MRKQNWFKALFRSLTCFGGDKEARISRSRKTPHFSTLKISQSSTWVTQNALTLQNQSKNSKRIEKTIKKRRITKVFHFTRIENLPYILEFGLVPRSIEPKPPMIITDENRLDHRLNCVCLSISFPNYKMFYSVRKQRFPSTQWCILSLDVSVLSELSCLFFPHNAAKYGTVVNFQKWRSATAFQDMFSQEGRTHTLPSEYPTNVQAEVQIEGVIPPSQITALHFEDVAGIRTFESLTPQLGRWPDIFKSPNLFRSRDYFLSK